MLDEGELAVADRQCHARKTRGRTRRCRPMREWSSTRPRSSADRATASGAVDRRSIRLGGTGSLLDRFVGLTLDRGLQSGDEDPVALAGIALDQPLLVGGRWADE